MTYLLNKIVDGCMNPLALGVFFLVLAGLLLLRGRKKCGLGFLAFGFVWLWFWSMPVTASFIGYSIERSWPPQRVEQLPAADAIILLGGGMGAAPEGVPYPTMYGAADRVWHAARLYRAGKAPLVIPTGVGAKLSEQPLLVDFGVPETAIVCEDEARNTEENAKFVAKLLAARAGAGKRVLLVTSALHMPRAKMMYDRYAAGLEIIPAPCDHEATIGWKRALEFGDFCPSVYSLATTSYAFKEHLGYWGYRLLRR